MVLMSVAAYIYFRYALSDPAFSVPRTNQDLIF